MDSKMTQFQIEAEKKIAELLAAAGLQVRDRRVITAQMPHMTGPETAVKLHADGVEIWLYSDEATFSTRTHDKRYERDDYATRDGLLAALLAELSGALGLQ